MVPMKMGTITRHMSHHVNKNFFQKSIRIIMKDDDIDEIKLPSRRKKYVSRYKKGRVYSKGRLVLKGKK